MTDLTLRVIMGLAGVGFVLSVVVHLTALLRSDPGWGQAVWGLHAGAILVAMPLILLVTGRGNDPNGWRTLTRESPPDSVVSVP